MIKPRDGEMNFKEIKELAFYYMFISACLSDQEYEQLKDEWNRQGGVKNKSYWEFVMENTKVTLDIQ